MRPSTYIHKTFDDYIEPIVDSNVLTPTISYYDPFFWSFDVMVDRDVIGEWTQSYLHYPHYKLHYIFEDEYFDHSEVWSDYTGDSFSNLRFDWQSVHEDYPVTLKNFFIQNQIDTPIFLKIKQSSYRPTYVYPPKRLVGMVARHGFHARIWSYYLASYNELLRTLVFPNFVEKKVNPNAATLNMAMFFPSTSFNSTSFDFDTVERRWKSDAVRLSKFSNWRFRHFLEDVRLEFELFLKFYHFLYRRLTEYQPVFSMRAKRVDKLRFKYSRGKTGKYYVEWRYVPAYKRLDVVLRWLSEDIILQKAPRFKQQIRKSLFNLVTSPSESLLKRNRDYVHRFVYSRYKNSLLKTLTKKNQ